MLSGYCGFSVYALSSVKFMCLRLGLCSHFLFWYLVLLVLLPVFFSQLFPIISLLSVYILFWFPLVRCHVVYIFELQLKKSLAKVLH